MALSALPATIVTTLTPLAVYNMVDLTNTATTQYRRVIQSIVVYNNSNINAQFVIRVGGNTVFKETLTPAQTFTVEGLKFVQLGTNNSGTKVSLEAITASSSFNVVITYTTINET